MARLKTVGFEQNTIEPDSELFFAFGQPDIVTNINPDTGQAYTWDDLEGEWDSEVIEWPIVTGNAIYEPTNVRSGYFALKLATDPVQFVYVRASTKGGGGYFRAYVKIPELPDNKSNFLAFISQDDDVNRCSLEIQSDGRLRVRYRNDSEVAAYIGEYSNPLEPGRYYALEFAIFGNEAGTVRTIEARIDHLRFMQAEVADMSSYDGYFGIGPNFDDDDTNTSLVMYADDVATNDGTGPDNNTWCGPGKCLLFPITGNDELAKVGTWSRGGTDTGSDWGQVSNAAPPTDGASFLIGENTGDRIDFRVASPYEYGLKDEDIINAVALNVRWAMENTSADATLHVYLRAGSNLQRAGNDVFLFGHPEYFTGDAVGISPDVYSTRFLPGTSIPWTVEELAGARIGMEVIEDSPDIYVTALWMYVDYQPYGDHTDYSFLLDGDERVHDVIAQSPRIEDRINEQANTLNFQLEDLHSIGIPETDKEVIVSVNGVRLFGGMIVRPTFRQISNQNDVIDVECVDFTRLLDRRLVAATFTNMTDKEIIEQIIAQFTDDNITTYHVSEGIEVNQISFNYVSVSQAIQQIAELTGRNWYIDYYKDIHYFPVTQSRAPFDITSDGNKHTGLSVSKDSSRLRNRVFVRGGTELTTDPITETIVADGEQRIFLLGDKPTELTVLVNGVEKTVGIKNIDEPSEFDFLLNYQEKYIECGTAFTTPASGDEITVTYKYYVPILVSVEDSASIIENATKTGGSGVFEFVIIDNQIASTQQARDRAAAELTDYANDMVDGGYGTMERGLRSGQYQHFDLPNKNVDDDYLIQSVTMQSLGGGLFKSSVSVTSAKNLGIIKFLIDLLQINRTVGQIDPNEKVDALFTVIDSLALPIDSLVIDSQGTGFPWAPDSGAPSTSLKWDLGQWS